MAKVEFQEFASRGLPIVVDGKAYQLPFQVFRWPTKEVSIRIGDNMIHFNAEGLYTGVEAKLDAKTVTQEFRKEYLAMLESATKNRAIMPRVPYFPKDSPGYHVEINASPGERSKVEDTFEFLTDKDGQVSQVVEMSEQDKELAILKALPASGIAHICSKIFGFGSNEILPPELYEDMKARIEALKEAGIVVESSTGTLSRASEQTTQCEQCNHLMVRNADRNGFICLNCGAKKHGREH